MFKEKQYYEKETNEKAIQISIGSWIFKFPEELKKKLIANLLRKKTIPDLKLRYEKDEDFQNENDKSTIPKKGVKCVESKYLSLIRQIGIFKKNYLIFIQFLTQKIVGEYSSLVF